MSVLLGENAKISYGVMARSQLQGIKDNSISAKVSIDEGGRIYDLGIEEDFEACVEAIVASPKREISVLLIVQPVLKHVNLRVVYHGKDSIDYKELLGEKDDAGNGKGSD